MEYNKMSDEQLIEKLRAGDNRIMEVLIEKYKGLVRQKAKEGFLLGGENDDLIQEGMIGLFKAIQGYEPDEGTSFYSFAMLCITRQMYTAIKAAGRKKHQPLNSYVSLYDTESEERDYDRLPLVETIMPSEENNPEDIFLNEEYAKRLENELKDRLSKLENRVLYLHLMGMDYLKIAEVMDKSPKTIDNALQRIKSKTKVLMDEKRE